MGSTNPFTPETYGKIRGYSPGTSLTAPTVLLYCRSLNPQFLELASRVDNLIASRPELKSSGVYLFDDKGAQKGGYTAEEVAQRIKSINEISAMHKLTVLSIGIAANSSPKSMARVGLNNPHDVMIVLFRPNVEANKRSVVAWLQAANSADLNQESIRKIIDLLKGAIEMKDCSSSRDSSAAVNGPMVGMVFAVYSSWTCASIPPEG